MNIAKNNTPANTVIVSQNVFTGLNDEAKPLAVGIYADRICWVAPAAHIVEMLSDEADTTTTPASKIATALTTEFPTSKNAAILNYKNAFVMPGFHDAHLHFFHSALYASPLAEQFVGANEQDCVERLAPLAQRRPKGSWLLTQGWREYLWNPPVMPSKHSLDAAYSDRPVAMYSGDAHTLWLNSCAMEELGLNPSSQAPLGGTYEKNAAGELTGIVRETAAMELMPKIVATFSTEELLDAYRNFQAQLNAHGITAICDMALSATPGVDFVRDDLFQHLENTGELTVRTHLFPTLLSGTTRLSELQARLQSPMLRACGFKQFFDGVSSQHTAWLHKPYTNARFPDDCGRPTISPPAMKQLVFEAARANQSVRIHTIGDEAIHQALDIFEKCPTPKPIFTLEHVENFQPHDIERLANLDVIASVQPRHITLDPGGPKRDLGDERLPYIWPLRTLLQSGATLAFGTDSPVTNIDPLSAVYTAVTGRDADTRLPSSDWSVSEHITVAEALRAYTLGSAMATGRADELGSLESGKFADITILSSNPLICDTEDIPNIKVLATYVGGFLR
ncbi:amidohydrolase [Adlercreutzia sp. ZJ304]|uniref:amidohydrolase n=1 Tax=Adlercreutzia sp. ZJ304 TaxID=2709791 RepID=UPI0013EBA28B|nr:amidohydrolase [Adlercreutzia sp. ZJ304]